MTEDTARALAERLHAGQVDKGGQPYTAHLAAVVANLRRRWPDAPPHAIAAAWLHDALEDTPATPEGLLQAGIPPEAVSLVVALTRPPGTTYRAWIADLGATADLWAVRIKLADNEHNSAPERRLPGSDMVERRYLPARLALEAALAVRTLPPGARPTTIGLSD